MPLTLYSPTGASAFTAGACVIGSENRPIWLGLTTVTTTGCARFWGSNGSGGGASAILTLTASPYTTIGPVGPFISSCGVAVADASGTGASAVVWMQR